MQCLPFHQALDEAFYRWAWNNFYLFPMDTCVWRPGKKCAVQVAEIFIADLFQSIIPLERIWGGKLLIQTQHIEPFQDISYIMAFRKTIVELQVKSQLPAVEIGEILIKLRRLY